MNITELIRDIEVLSIHGEERLNPETPVKGIQNHSGKLKEGELFIAIPGFEADGHDYLDAAAAKGAVAAIVERIKPELQLVQIQVKNARKAQAEIAAQFYDHPSKELRLCGITGSNGKTTTSLMLHSILEEAGEASGIIGTVAYRTGQSEVESKLTTPDSPDLQRYLREMIQSAYKSAIMEVSSIGQTQYRAHATQFAVAIFLNLGREHLDFHGNIENYYAAKKPLIVNLPETATAILNADDEYSIALKAETKAKVISFGLGEEADVRAVDIDLSSGFAEANLLLSERVRKELDLPEEDLRFKLRVPGFHSLMNALAAAAAGLALGYSPRTCLQGLERYGGVERRFQEIYHEDFRIFDDHFANAGNIRMTLETLAKMDYKRLHLLYAIRGKRGVTVNRENIEAFLPFIPKLRLANFVATLSRDTAGHYDEVLPEEEQVFKEAMEKGACEYELTERLEEAIEKGLAYCEPGDLLLLAGCQGMDAGGRIALTALAEKYPDRKEEILAPIKDRVCGW